MRVCLDTSALNWMADNSGTLEQLLMAMDRGSVSVLVHPETADEIRRTPDPDRRSKLESVLSHFVPLGPTRVPRLGTMRLGLARLPTAQDEARLEVVNFLRDGSDRTLVTNAAGDRCDAFVTHDGEMAKRNLGRLEAELGGTRVLRPEQFFAELAKNHSEPRDGASR